MGEKALMNKKKIVLELRQLCRHFGGLKAVHEVDLVLEEDALNGLIGPNGSGKTTMFNVITGIYEPTFGDVLFEGEKISGLEPHVINQMGIARTFQNIRLFPDLTVLDNVRIAYHTRAGYGMLDATMRTRNFAVKERELTEEAQEFLSVFNLQDRQTEIAKNLPYGEQRRLEIARALAANPKVLLLDEPAAGMNPNEVKTLMDLIYFIREKFNLTVLLIEHQMRVVMGICEHITVMDFGQVIARGSAKEVQNDSKVIEAYLGPGIAELSKNYLKERKR